MQVGAVILTGGKSRRMGQSKEWLPLGGVPMLARVVATLAHCCAPLVVVARDHAQALPSLPGSVLRTCDATPDGGPLAGLLAGLQCLAEQPNAPQFALLAACDMPFLHTAEVRALCAARGTAELLMLQDERGLQPLAMLLALRLLPELRARASAGDPSLHGLSTLPKALVLSAPASRALSPTGGLWRSVNTPEEWRAAQEAHGGT